MKKLCVCLSFLLFLSCMALPTAAVESTPKGYSDIAGHWAEEVILRWQGAGFMDGYEDGTFRPEGFVTQAELAKIITLAFGLTEKYPIDLYVNLVDESAWYYPYFETTALYFDYYEDQMIAYTEEHKTFTLTPDVYVRRISAAEIACRLKMGLQNITIHFPPINIIAGIVDATYVDPDLGNLFRMHGWIPDNIRRRHNYMWLVTEFGLMQGDGDGAFRDEDLLSRAELITILDRLLTQLGREP